MARFDATKTLIIQRIGCERVTGGGKDGEPPRTEQAAGCGGFGKGNFSELFKSIENYETHAQGVRGESESAHDDII